MEDYITILPKELHYLIALKLDITTLDNFDKAYHNDNLYIELIKLINKNINLSNINHANFYRFIKFLIIYPLFYNHLNNNELINIYDRFKNNTTVFNNILRLMINNKLNIMKDLYFILININVNVIICPGYNKCDYVLTKNINLGTPCHMVAYFGKYCKVCSMKRLNMNLDTDKNTKLYQQLY